MTMQPGAVQESETPTPQGSETPKEEVPAWAQKIIDGQAALNNRQQYLERKVETAQRRGQSADPTVLRELASVRQSIESNQVEEQIKNLDMTEAQAEAFRKLHTAKTTETPAEPDEIDEEELGLRAETEFEDNMLPMFTLQAQLAGLDLTPAMQEEIRQDFASFELHVDGTTGAFKNLRDFEKRTLARIAKTVEPAWASTETPAQKAGKTLGEGGRPGGAVPPPKLDFFKTSYETLMKSALEKERQR